MIYLFQQLMASKSDAPFRDAKTKLLEIRAQQSKRVEARGDTKSQKSKKKKQKKDDGHVWSWFAAIFGHGVTNDKICSYKCDTNV